MKPEQKMEQNACCMNCGNNNCCHNDFHGNSPKYILLRWLLALLILAVTFSMGFKLGEFKQGFLGDSHYGPNMHYKMMRGMDDGMYPPVMMFDRQVMTQETAPVPATSSKKLPVVPVK